MKAIGVIIIVLAIAALAWIIFLTRHPFVSFNTNPNPTSTTPQTGTRSINLYFPNSKLDPLATCPRVFPVERLVADTPAILRDALAALLQGPSSEDNGKGYATDLESEVAIQSLRLEDGLAAVDLNKPLAKDDASACKLKTASAQIEATLRQFPNVNNVIVTSNGHSQL